MGCYSRVTTGVAVEPVPRMARTKYVEPHGFRRLSSAEERSASCRAPPSRLAGRPRHAMTAEQEPPRRRELTRSLHGGAPRRAAQAEREMRAAWAERVRWPRALVRRGRRPS